MKPLPLFCCSVLLLLSACGAAPDPSRVKVSEQPADGLSPSAFDEAYLQRLAEQTRQSAEARLQQAYDRNQVASQARRSHALVSARYEWLGSRRLAVVELGYSANPMRVTRVVGLVGDRLLTVSCIYPEGEPADLHAATGECAEALRQHFPVRSDAG